MKLKKVAPGMYEDEDGAVHIDAPELLEYYGIEPTPENIETLAQASAEIARERGIPHEDLGREPWSV